MTNKVILNNVDHHELKVSPGSHENEKVNLALIFPTEFVDAQREYPILFRLDAETDSFQCVALLGFDKNENLFLLDGQWNARYVPALFARGPFSIAVQKQEMGSETSVDPKVHIDLDDPRVNTKEGYPLFLPHGGNSAYTNKISATLSRIYDGAAIAKHMFDAYRAAELLEPVDIEVNAGEGKTYRIKEYYTINEERLLNLESEKLQALNQRGFLRCAYLVLASLDNLSRLGEMKARLLQQ